MGTYETKIKYEKGKEIVFPDFSLVYLGKRHRNDPAFKPGFTYYDFQISKDSVKQIVSWSSGTGDIAPKAFKVGGKDFYLELSTSIKLGRLDDQEMAVWDRAYWKE
jgi:hypothetical protein